MIMVALQTHLTVNFLIWVVQSHFPLALQVCIKVIVINFTVTKSGLEDQLLRYTEVNMLNQQRKIVFSALELCALIDKVFVSVPTRVRGAAWGVCACVTETQSVETEKRCSFTRTSDQNSSFKETE